MNEGTPPNAELVAKMTPEGFEDKRRAAFHEAGHATIGRACNLFSSDAMIGKRADGRWDGSCDYDETTGRGRCVFGMAGATAEWLAVYPDCEPLDVVEAVSRGDVVASESDRQSCRSDESRIAAIHQAHRILKKYIHFLEWAASHLIDHERLTTEVALVEFERLYPRALLESENDE
jgi:hypothetical protein